LAGFVADATAQSAEPVFPPASRIGIVPPPGFVVSATFLGYQHNDKQANILMAELPSVAYEALEKEIAAELERNPGTQRRDMQLKDGGTGFLLTGVQQGPQGPVLRWTMVAKAHDVTAVVTALVPEALKEVLSEEAVRTSFATLTVRTSVPVAEQLSVLPFTLSELSGFRIVRVQPGSAAMLTDGPKDEVEPSQQPLFLVSAVPSPVPPLQERENLARRFVGEIPGLKDVRLVRSEALRVLGQQGHEIIVEAKDAKTGDDLTSVQWLRFGSGALMRIVGIARKDAWEKTFPRFRAVRDGIEQK
jgi:hypothetical protein